MEGVQMYVNLPVPYRTYRKRPDILLIDDNKMLAYIIELRVVVEENDLAF